MISKSKKTKFFESYSKVQKIEWCSKIQTGQTCLNIFKNPTHSMCLNVVQQFKMFKKVECIQNVQTCSKAIELFKDAKNQKNEYARHRKSYATYFQGGVTLWICMELYIFCSGVPLGSV